MKKCIFLLVFLLFGIATASVDRTKLIGPWIEKKFDLALELSKKEKKNIFVFVSGKDCGGCLLLKKKVFPDKDFQNYLKKFVLYHADYDSKEDKAFVEKYKFGYPYLAVISPKGQVLKKIIGYHKINEIRKEITNIPDPI